jgi:hypothetical protein
MSPLVGLWDLFLESHKSYVSLNQNFNQLQWVIAVQIMSRVTLACPTHVTDV